MMKGENGNKNEAQSRTPLDLASLFWCIATRTKTCKANLVSRYTYSVIAGATVDRAVILGQEWHLCLSTALSANNGVHLSWSAFGSSTRTARRIATCCTTGRTTTGLVHQPFLLVEFLLTGGEDEIITALTTL